MEAETRRQKLAEQANAAKKAAEAARREEQARQAIERNLELQRQWRESEALKQVGCRIEFCSATRFLGVA